MLYNFIVGFSFLLIATFSYWYSSKLAVYKNTSFFLSFLVVLISYTIAGSFKLLSEKYLSHYSLILMFTLLIFMQIYLGKILFKENFKKSAIASILSIVVTIIIGLPILVLAGIALTYLNIKQG